VSAGVWDRVGVQQQSSKAACSLVEDLTEAVRQRLRWTPFTTVFAVLRDLRDQLGRMQGLEEASSSKAGAVKSSSSVDGDRDDSICKSQEHSFIRWNRDQVSDMGSWCSKQFDVI